MLDFKPLLEYWGTTEFSTQLRTKLKTLTVNELPLQQGLSYSSIALDHSLDALILNIQDNPQSIQIKAGIFYKGAIAGCNCADDPTPMDENEEYCDILIHLNKINGLSTIELLI